MAKVEWICGEKGGDGGNRTFLNYILKNVYKGFKHKYLLFHV